MPTKINLTLFVAMTLSMTPIAAMYHHIALNENDISSLVTKQLLSPDETVYHHYSVPQGGAFLTIEDNFCNPPRIALKIEQGTEYITLFRAKEGTIKVIDDNNRKLAKFSIFPVRKK
jgi:hypothetical protein